MLSSIRRLLAAILVIALSALPLPGTAGAAMVPTDDATSRRTADGDVARTRLAAALARPALAEQLAALGIAPEEAARRVATLDDSTAIDASAHLDRMPAGGAILGVAVFIIAVLVLTEVLGITRIFPFSRR